MRRLLLLLPLLVLGCSGSEDGSKAVGSTAPDIKVETLVAPATTTSLATKRGKVVLLDFWATWCGPCRQISPTLDALYQKHKGEGLEAMAITDEAREIVALVEKQRPHSMPVYLDASDGAHRAFGASGLPTIVVVDRGGHIVYSANGVGPTTPDDIASAITKALGQA